MTTPTPRIVAAEETNNREAQLLINKGANIEAIHKADRTPLLVGIMSRSGRDFHIFELINKGVKFEATDKHGRIPLIIIKAAEGGNLNIVRAVKEFEFIIKHSNENVRPILKTLINERSQHGC
jgi:hypothetical protein